MAGKPLNIYTFVPRRAHASYYYRVTTPIQTAQELGLNVRVMVDTDDASISTEQHVQAFCEADVALLYHPISDSTLHNVRMAKSLVTSKQEGGWKHAPTIVVDSDDNLFAVSPYNPAFRTLGIRDPEGKPIPAGSVIGCVEDGQRKVLWKDGENGFHLAQNQANLLSYTRIVEIADAFTCTTDPIEQGIRKECIPSRTQVFPNLMRMNDYPQLDLVQNESQVRILWQGGANHWEDFFPLREAFGTITNKYPNVHWIICGALYPWALELIPPDRYTFVDWVPYDQYKLRIVMHNHDISLAPLSTSTFNDARSSIKFMEAAMPKKPAATLAQNFGPYQREIIPGETGLLFNDATEFTDQLSRLIEDVSLRKTLAANAKQWVSEHRDATKFVPRMFAYYEQLREETIRETPHMPNTDWEQFEARIKEQEAQEAQPAAA